jgi:fumarate hydratase subunit alpha
MRSVPFNTVVNAVETMVQEANYNLPGDVLDALKRARAKEVSSQAVYILDQIIENAVIASSYSLPLCQDTGAAVFFVDIGDEVYIDGDGLEVAVNEGTRRGYKNGGLRMSMVSDPLHRLNTGDNTPAVIHVKLVKGEQFTIYFCPKGGGCENMSRLAMLSPGEGRKGVVDFVVETVLAGGGKPCPPLIAGVGIGGNFEYAAILSKRSLLRAVGGRNSDPYFAELEMELIEKINNLGIGPMGLGGTSTVLDVFVESAPCHIASLPVAVNIQCHSARHKKIEL